MKNFYSFNFKSFIIKGISELGFRSFTDIQKKIIPFLLNNKNIICNANPGTGKTYSFIFYILNNINYDLNQLQSIIIIPTRELAKQIYNNLIFFKKYNLNLNISCLIGGEEINKQYEKIIKKKPKIIIVTPERFLKILKFNIFNLNFLFNIIIDEYDMIFDLNFLKNILFLLKKILKKNVNISLFSATFSNNLKNFLLKFLNNFKMVFLDLINNKEFNSKVKHILIYKNNYNFEYLLLNLLKIINPYLCLIFINKIKDIKKYFDLLNNNNFSVCQLHSDLSFRYRNQILKRIKNLQYNYIISSDLSSRGIDIIGITHIISLNFPIDLSYYFHRSGRTGRNNNYGYSYIFYDENDIKFINKLINNGIFFEYMKFDFNNNLIKMKKKW